MTKNSQRTSRVFKVFRYDPTMGEDGHFDRYRPEVDSERKTTILDGLFRIQRKHDSSLSFRYSCRVGMCGSCGMVINGRESLACKTVIAELKENEITIRPLNHFPVIKDLVVDLSPFFEKYQQTIPFFQPFQEAEEPAIIRPDSKERKIIGLATECIACGCCVSSCTMAHWYEDYVGPAALNRAFTLLADSRDGLHDKRLAQATKSCYNCRLEFNCTEVCPKEISPTRAIRYIQRLALKETFQGKPPFLNASEAKPPIMARSERGKVWTRRWFLTRATLGLAGATTLFLGGLFTAAALVPSMKVRIRKWVRVGKMEEFPPESTQTVNISYPVRDGFYLSQVTKPVLVSRQRISGDITVFSSRCTHLGCTVRWDEGKKLFLCACHGGAFYPDGRVKSGPPPRPLDRYLTRVQDGELFIQEA